MDRRVIERHYSEYLIIPSKLYTDAGQTYYFSETSQVCVCRHRTHFFGAFGSSGISGEERDPPMVADLVSLFSDSND